MSTAGELHGRRGAGESGVSTALPSRPPRPRRVNSSFMVAVGFATGCTALDAAAAELAEAAKRILEQTNEFRAAQSVEPVATSRELAAAADAFARFIAQSANLSHTADGRQPAERASAQGYDPCIVSENIAYLYRSAGYDAPALAEEMVEGWKKSPGHRKNMLDPAV